ncbi:PREDICTED: HEAT repeat-containing protein 6 isoform X2 [Camelina sativa]|uniref:HEAT repeat-containing protein 6 isoform X2 n=1 Tax=Camelina sativa TaxID=90675 RepID=A0ABM0U6Z1_CAMSA|nr:PREDICTED: HEAT repeat-containing protein 6 isoform X2 [Camelina sativa]
MFTAAASSSAGRWRTAFLSLRDEILTTPPPPLPLLLQDLLFSQSHSLLSAVSHLPPHELTSDCLFLLDLVSKADDGPDWILVSRRTCQLIHDVCARVLLQLNSSSWPLLLHSFACVLEFLLRQPMPSPYSTAYFSRIEPVIQCFETLRRLAAMYHGNSSHPEENIHLVKFLLRIIPLLHQDLVLSYGLSKQDPPPTLDVENNLPQHYSLWESMALAFDMFGRAFSVSESLFSTDVCQCTLEVLRKVMDVLASKGQLVEDRFMWRFYSCLLDCVHEVLTNIKCPVSDHVSSFIAALRLFFCFGLTGPPHSDVVHKDKQLNVKLSTLISGVSKNAKNTPYRPPHLRKRDDLNTKQPVSCDWRRLSLHDSGNSDVISSDSDFSDSDASVRDSCCSQSSKVRIAAIVCIQDLCQADSKSFTTQWMTLFPTSDVLNPRKSEATLMTCLLFDPHLKVRIASASALAIMMDGPSSIFLQVAEYKESTKYGSFMPLSNSLGRILMQLHTGILHLIHSDNHGRLLTQLFKILLLLISSTPYSRMPGELLPKVIMSLHARINEGFPFKNDKTGLLVAAIGCLTAAFSTFPPQMKVHNMLLDETSAGSDECEWNSGVLSTLFRFAEQFSDASTCVEALQVLRAVALSYPNLVPAYWERVSVLVYKLLMSAVDEVSPTTWKASVRESVGYIGDKVLTAAIKVLDGCLRAISGFKGTEDLQYDRLMDTPFTSDCIRSIRISSAPSYGFENAQEPIFQAGCEQWSEAIRKHIVLVLHHGSSVVRSTTVTCFAGITSTIFAAFSKQEKDFVTSSIIAAALHDKTPSVRSAACRAIGVISCFPETSLSAEIYEKFFIAVEANTRDSLTSVRITASWALANVCDSLRYRVDERSFEGLNTTSQVLDALIQCALRLTEDGDKVKSNAVRALGSISKYVKLRCMTCRKSMDQDVLPFPHQHSSNSHHLSCAGDTRWLERTVQAFLSCVTTGNVKVQWNVCHALSNLFSNETIKLQDMDWAPSVFSILLLLLRDASNFKIRIQAAAALAVPGTPLAYGRSFPDVVKGVEHTLQSLHYDRETTPTNFKYKRSLENQLTSTMLHLLSLVSSCHFEALTEFLSKKSSFLEDWLRGLCVTLHEEDNASGSSSTSTLGDKQKKELISRAIRSLARSLQAGQSSEMALKLQELDSYVN